VTQWQPQSLIATASEPIDLNPRPNLQLFVNVWCY